MLQEKYNFKLLYPVLNIGFEEDYLFFADAYYGIYLYSLINNKVVFGKRVAHKTIKHHIYSKAIACSDRGHILISSANGGACALYRIVNQELKLQGQMKWHKANISSAVFSKDASLFATGGEDGRVFVYSTSDAKFYTILPVQPEYIACMNFDSKNQYFAFATYEKKIFIFDLKTCEIIIEFKTPSVVESLEFFNQDKQIIYVCKDGEIGVFDLLTRHYQNRKIDNAWLQQCILHPNEKYAYIAGRCNRLIVYKVENNSITLDIELPESGVSFMRIIGDYLCICFVSGRILFLNQKLRYDEFAKLLETKNYEESKALAEEYNILLKLEALYETVRIENWQEVLKDIVNLFINNQADSALNIAEPYLEDPTLEKEFRYYFDEKEIVAQFLLSIKQEKYLDAYMMAKKKRGLKKLRLFKELENCFNYLFEASKKMLEQDSGNLDKVKKILEPFSKIEEKKESIDFLMHNFEQYENIEQAVKNQDYRQCFQLAYNYPFLQKSKSYQKALQICSDLLYSLKDKMHHQSNAKMQKTIEFLREIPFFKDEAEALMNFLTKQEDLKKSFKTRDFYACYKLLEEYPNLHSSDVYFDLEGFVLGVFKEALESAKMGNTKEVFNRLCSYFGLHKWQTRIESIFQIAYFYEIKYNNLEDMEIDWHATLQQYIGFFGKTSEFRALCYIKNLGGIFDDIIEKQEKKVKFLETILIRDK